VARYYLADIAKNKAISTEITGYAASAFVYLHALTGREAYLNAGIRAAQYLVREAWNRDLKIFPFEPGSNLSYFFDSGIIVRGLLAVWRVTKEQQLLDIAAEAAHGMLKDFDSGVDFHPILTLPDKKPLARDERWSRSSGCYQSKSALAWQEVSEITGDRCLRDAYLRTLGGPYREFLPGTSNRHGIMDRLHAACYFLEALKPELARAEFAEAHRFMCERVDSYLREIAPEFARSDVYAQALRARRSADYETALVTFQARSGDPRIDGGFYFGRRNGEIVPHVNPVSTAFAIQALEVCDSCPHPVI
jgi:hypothetical protein